MKSFRLTLRGGLIATLLMFALLISVIGGGSYLAMKQARDAFDSVYALNVVQLGTAREVYAALMQTRVLLDSYQTDYNRLRVKPAKKTWAQAEATFDRAQQRLSELTETSSLPTNGVSTDDGISTGDGFSRDDGVSMDKAIASRFHALIDEGIRPSFDSLKAWDVSAYQANVQKANELTASLDASLATLTAAAKTNATAGAAAMNRNVRYLELGLPATAMIALLLVGLVFYLFQRQLLRPLDDVRRHCADIARGDLSQRLSPHGVREMSELKSGVDAMRLSLLELVSQLQQESRALRDDALELTQASHTLNDQSEHQAQALQQTTASMEEITATVSHTAEHADHGRTLSAENQRWIDSSGEQVSTAISEMQAARARSEASLEVITMIDSLTFQTNLLALNASVEAARAGIHGRGFAVVAEEVRRLSASSAEAAGTIREQIEGTHRQVQQGTRVLNQAGETLSTAVHSSQQLGELLDGIALSCQQQRDGIRQVDEAISAIDAATQRNVTLAARTLQATQALDVRARRQQERCDAFKLTAPPSVAPDQKPTAGGADIVPEPDQPDHAGSATDAPRQKTSPLPA